MTVGFREMSHRNQNMSGISQCRRHTEMTGRPPVCPAVVCVCLSRAFSASVMSELACLSCLCVGIVSGLSGHCIPDMW